MAKRRKLTRPAGIAVNARAGENFALIIHELKSVFR
jgi:hypothetical protein